MKVIAAAIRNPKTGVTKSLPPPARHVDLYSQFRDMPLSCLEGFLLEDGTFVDRHEAFRYARAEGQLKEGRKGPPELITNDIW